MTNNEVPIISNVVSHILNSEISILKKGANNEIIKYEINEIARWINNKIPIIDIVFLLFITLFFSFLFFNNFLELVYLIITELNVKITQSFKKDFPKSSSGIISKGDKFLTIIKCSILVIK